MTKNEFYSTWLRRFANGISREKIEKYVVSTGNYLWHVFSWELIAAEELLTGDQARLAFDRADKTSCICCDMYNGNGVTDHLPSRFDTAEKIDSALSEYYVVAGDYTWTYIKTHEGDNCGPYFLKENR